jgi:tetratricopeptide (TPR) repeat protein
MAQLAIEQGVPGEAQKVMESGFANKVLGADEKQKERHTRLLNSAKKAADQDKASLVQQTKDAEKAPTGQAWVGVGQAYLSYDQYDQAIDALQKGIKKGGLKSADEAQIQLGIAYLKKNQREQARSAFKAVPADSPFSKAAALWSLRANSAA